MIDWDRVELFFQGVFFRFSFVVFFVLFVSIFFYAYYTEQRAGPEMVQAPFEVAGSAQVIETESGAISQPHRTRREMQIWVVDTVSELLNFDQENKNELLRLARPSFSAAGLAQYQEWMNSFDMAAKAGTGEGRLSAIVDDAPIMLNSGAIGGVYRWLFDVPVVISLLPPQSSRSDTPIESRKVMLRLQAARSENADSPYQVVIESWTFTARR